MEQIAAAWEEEMSSLEFQIKFYLERYRREMTGADIFLELLNELEKAQKQSMCFAALGIAFILPDMCAKIEYEKKTTEKEYTEWVDKYVCPLAFPDDLTFPDEQPPLYIIYGDGKGHYAPRQDEIYNIPTSLFTGEIIYRLRCSFFHEGVPDTFNPRKPNDFISSIDFTFKLEDIDVSSTETGISYTPKQFHVKEEETVVSLAYSAQVICSIIHTAAKKYFEQNKEKFESITYSVKDMRTPIE